MGHGIQIVRSLDLDDQLNEFTAGQLRTLAGITLQILGKRLFSNGDYLAGNSMADASTSVLYLQKKCAAADEAAEDASRDGLLARVSKLESMIVDLSNRGQPA